MPIFVIIIVALLNFGSAVFQWLSKRTDQAGRIYEGQKERVIKRVKK